MPDTYIQDVTKIIDALSRDGRPVLEERLILLGMVTDYAMEVTRKLEGELDKCRSGLIQ